MKLLTVALLLLFPIAAHAETLEKVISNETYDINVAISAGSVRCSSLGYGRPELKVDVPDLDWAASFNHRQQGEGQPCMTVGLCDARHSPDKVRAGGDGDVPTRLQVVHKEVGVIDKGVCSRELVEHVTMELRGFTFAHERSAPLPSLSATECRRILK